MKMSILLTSYFSVILLMPYVYSQTDEYYNDEYNDNDEDEDEYEDGYDNEDEYNVNMLNPKRQQPSGVNRYLRCTKLKQRCRPKFQVCARNAKGNEKAFRNQCILRFINCFLNEKYKVVHHKRCKKAAFRAVMQK